MSGTRSLSPTAPATERRAEKGETPAAIIVAHGSPSEPAKVERAIARLAADVCLALPGRRVTGATLAAPGALDAALSAAGDAVVIYPMFMADGWFVRKALPKRLQAADRTDCAIARPFGLEPAVRALCLQAALEAVAERALPVHETTLLLAAHGSPSDPRPREAAEEVAAQIAAAGLFREVRTGYVDQEPLLADAARVEAPAICLPLFATRAGHVEIDLPEALADFPGDVLDPIGTHPHVPRIVANALAGHA